MNTVPKDDYMLYDRESIDSIWNAVTTFEPQDLSNREPLLQMLFDKTSNGFLNKIHDDSRQATYSGKTDIQAIWESIRGALLASLWIGFFISEEHHRQKEVSSLRASMELSEASEEDELSDTSGDMQVD